MKSYRAFLQEIGTMERISVHWQEAWVSLAFSDAPACAECGALMVRNGACYKCLNCGSVFGCS